MLFAVMMMLNAVIQVLLGLVMLVKGEDKETANMLIFRGLVYMGIADLIFRQIKIAKKLGVEDD